MQNENNFLWPLSAKENTRKFEDVHEKLEFRFLPKKYHL